ncbi:iron-regulated transporter [Aulographum hederae CBS 113979]|uniref:Solute carrier family 40 member n=1 Tax=Aulographum hederae CBS 113979 TaxID=1176131 RepID=A0A6G1GXP2_9PEZI|nr:iron-regulated transporter [Aulographum hederae CBS 113979]
MSLGPDVYADQPATEEDPLLGPSRRQEDLSPTEESEFSQWPVETRVVRRLYVSHILSSWNSRVFEFGAILYLAKIFPGTLRPMSAYALARGLAAMVFAPVVGQYIDSGNRLQVVRVSIVGQRIAVAVSCVIFLLLEISVCPIQSMKIGMLVLLTLLACVEKLCATLNTVSVERDWVVVIAQNEEAVMRTMNAQMRRVDLLCKLLGPLFISLIDGFSTRAAIITNLAMNVVSVIVEYYAIVRVYRDVPELQQQAQTASSYPDRAETDPEDSDTAQGPRDSQLKRVWTPLKGIAVKYAADFGLYFRHRAFVPSIAGALLYLTVLSFSGQMVTYLLSTNYTSTMIGVARTFSVAFEVLATWVAPWLMGKIGPIRAGLWLSSWQVGTLAIGVAIFWAYLDKPLVSASGLVGGTVLSRVGLRGFDLCTQLIVQEEVEASARGVFSSVEAAWQNGFEILSYASTLALSRPNQFKFPALISVLAVATASLAYTLFVRMRRGHLVHLEKVLCTSTEKRRERQQAIERIVSRDN